MNTITSKISTAILVTAVLTLAILNLVTSFKSTVQAPGEPIGASQGSFTVQSTPSLPNLNQPINAGDNILTN